MSNEEVTLRKGKLIEDFVAAKAKLQMLQEEARSEGKVLDAIVEFLKSGGDRGQISMGTTLEAYLSGKVAKLVVELRDAIHEKNELKQRLSSIGAAVTD